MQQGTVARRRGLLASLFDFHFTNLIATSVISVVYGLLVVVYTVVALIMMIALIVQGQGWIAVGIIGVPIAYILYLIFLRISMEFFIVVFQIAADIRALRLQYPGQAAQVAATGPSPVTGWPSAPPGPAAMAAGSPPAAPSPSGPSPSPSGWQAQGASPATSEHHGQLSADGRYWWDGQSWQPTGR